MTPTVSVIIPTNRVDSWLDEAVQSALDSSDVSIEVIVVINGPASFEPRSWTADPRVVLVHERSRLGPTRAMIEGVARARGEFVARLDADDRMLPLRLSEQVARLRAQPTAPLVGTATSRITPEGEPAGNIRMPSGDDVRRHLVLFNCIPHSSVMLRRSALEEVGGYDESLEQMEDYDLILRLSVLGPVPVLTSLLTEYRIHPGQLSRGATPYGLHIQRISVARRTLGRALGMNRLSVAARDALWRAAQYARYHRVTRPGHEY
ncbi:hypothetical protein BOH66_12910 [Microbacterium aurum]|uniref:Glycosyltransferase 2-like domain-containing protein n=1 Tax=Microbacterium aurum TaxID=36805 RepID=A0A1P8UA98_9MICO|nr:hypothetical protein BOH66_12910 [Microbacterium aurum]